VIDAVVERVDAEADVVEHVVDGPPYARERPAALDHEPGQRRWAPRKAMTSGLVSWDSRTGIALGLTT
jgi:hypothetical protein